TTYGNIQRSRGTWTTGARHANSCTNAPISSPGWRGQRRRWQDRNDSLAGDRGLALDDQRPHSRGEIDVDTRAHRDEAAALAAADDAALAHARHDAARDEPGNLHHTDARAAAGNDQRIALIVLAGLVEVGIDEFSRRVDHALDAPARRAAIHVA